MTRDIDNTQDVLDVRDIIERIEELEDDKSSFEHDDGGNLTGASWVGSYPEEAAELQALMALLDDLKGNGGDEEWRGDWYPVTLVRDSYFQEYAQELVEELYSQDMKGFPAFIEIDWNATARNIRVDYTSAEFDGVTYWYR